MMEEKNKEKLVPIEPLEPKTTKRAGRKPDSPDTKVKKRMKKGLPPQKDIIQPTPARLAAVKKSREVKKLKREYRNSDDEQRKYELAVQINSLTPNKVEVPSITNKDLKKNIQYQNPTYKEEGLEDYSLHHNPTTKNIEQPPTSDKILQWSDGTQSLWANKLSQLETKMNNIDNYLSKIRVLSGEGTSADYSNPANVKQNHYIQPHTQKITPHQSVFDPSPFHSSFSFKKSVMKR